MGHKRIVTISNVERLGTSTNGNPTYRLTFEGGGTAETARDSGLAYEITNSEYRQGPVELTFEGNVIVSATPVSDGAGR